jgi:hypothetical protein
MSEYEAKVSELPPESAWEPESLRLTLFHNRDIVEQTWWKDLFGTSADKIDDQPKKLLHIEEGQFGNGKLLQIIQLGRIDWQYVIDLEKGIEIEEETPLTLGEFPSAVDVFLKQMLKWFELQTCPSAYRLAFGVVLLQKVESLKTGYKLIEKYLPDVKLYPECMSDFMYRINKPRESKTGIEGLKINRLATWSVAGYTLMRGIIPITGLGKNFQYPEKFACRLELDINTSQEYQSEFDQEGMPEILRELVELGREIAQKGDIL